MKSNWWFIVLLAFLISSGIHLESCRGNKKDINEFPDHGGKLFIIGGGDRPVSMMQRMVEESGILDGGYAVVLPMASAEPDSAAFYITRDLNNLGVQQVFPLMFNRDTQPDPVRVDSLAGAKLIYITGGDQNKFMQMVLGTPVFNAIHRAFQNGAMIAGTSAGAAVMSKKMITGNQKRYPEYTGEFRTIEADNIEIAEGLGLLDEVIVDQHFIYRQRMNRLITVAIEHPDEIAVGIDESTAILVKGRIAEVVGNSQVVVIRNPEKSFNRMNNLLGANGLIMDIFLPGQQFALR